MTFKRIVVLATAEARIFWLVLVTIGLVSTEAHASADLFNYKTKSRCEVVSIQAAPSSKVIERKRVKLEQALEWFTTAISSAKAIAGNAKILAEQLESLAEASAFTKLNWAGSGSSPAHWQTNLLKNIAIAVDIVDHQNGWAEKQREKVVAWGDTVFKNSHYPASGYKPSARWPDTVATAASAYIFWGVVAPNKTAFADGKKDFTQVAKLLKKTGGTRSFFDHGKYLRELPKDWGTRIEDKLLGDMVMAAHVAGRSGVNLFDLAPGGTSLYQAIASWQDTLFANNGAAVKGDDLTFLTPFGGERSWSWTEYFIADYPDDPATALLRSESKRIALANRYGYIGRATGPSTCLFR